MRLAPNWPRTPLVLLGILVASLYLLQYAVLPRYDHLPLVTASFFDFRMALVTWGDWHWADAVLLAFLFFLCVALEYAAANSAACSNSSWPASAPHARSWP
jgi:type II secretory pathway component PulF